jgi:hypothetical protein
VHARSALWEKCSPWHRPRSRAWDAKAACSRCRRGWRAAKRDGGRGGPPTETGLVTTVLPAETSDPLWVISPTKDGCVGALTAVFPLCTSRGPRVFCGSPCMKPIYFVISAHLHAGFIRDQTGSPLRRRQRRNRLRPAVNPTAATMIVHCRTWEYS